jgi:RNA polymerase sigma-70 factor (ECF subfamily)
VHRPEDAAWVLLWAGVQVRAEVPVSPFVRLPRQVKRDAVPRALVAGRAELVAFARRRVGPRAEDLVHDASVRALARADQLSDPSAARAWLFAIVRRLIAERVGAEPEPLEGNDGPSPDSDVPPEVCACVLTHLRALPAAQATLLERVVVDGVDVSSLATELGITPNNAWVRLHRARRALKDRLAAHCGTASLRQCLDCGCLERGCCR